MSVQSQHRQSVYGWKGYQRQSRWGLGAVRVMRTCVMMGETVGKAAWIAVRYQTTPRGVYQSHLSLLPQLMQ